MSSRTTGALSNPTAVSVTSSATQIIASRSGRLHLLIQNLGSADLYVGTSGVTTSTGVKVASGSSLELQEFAGTLYGITSSSTADVRILDQG